VPVTTITISRQQRDGLYELVRNDLGSVGDLFDALETEKDYGAAERLGIEFGEDFRLLQDLGWRPDEARETFELTIPPHDLMEVLQRLRGDAEKLLRESPAERRSREEDEATNERFRVGRDTCTALLTDLDPREAKPSRPSASDLVIADRDEERPRPTLTIGASERNILYRLMVHRLYVLGDRPDEPQGSSGDLYRDFAEDVELIENLGWLSGNDLGQGVDLHMPAARLAETLTRLREVARRASTETRLGLDSRETVDQRQGWFRDAICTCDELLSALEASSSLESEPR
jgi:hypothetical protein